MMEDHELEDKLDRYAKGKLSVEELNSLQENMKRNNALRKKAEDHIKLINALKFYRRRETIKQTLNTVALEHDDITVSSTPVIPISKSNQRIRKYWPIAAVAASVAFFSILGTMFVTKSFETEQSATYKELRRDMEQIQKKQNLQNQVLADIAKTTEKASPTPSRYAGTGFLVSPTGYVITSHHVVKGADSVYIENTAYGTLKTTVVFSDAANDISILRIDNAEFKAPRNLPFTVSSGEASLGEDVYTLGFPREDVVFGEGSISALSGYRQNPNAYQVSVPVNPGNSGGPLFNMKGDLVGIISGIQTETSGAAFAIKSTVILDVINELPQDSLHLPLLLPKQNTIKHLNKVDQVKKWADNVFIVRVYNSK